MSAPAESGLICELGAELIYRFIVAWIASDKERLERVEGEVESS